LNIGITGSTGFFGTALSRYLDARGLNLVSLDSFVHPDRKGSKTGQLPENLDWVIHFGASKSIEDAFRRPTEIYRRNLDSTLAALDIAQKQAARFLYMSSYVYGHPEYLPVDEKHPVNVLNPYMGSKLVCEEICRQMNKTIQLNVMILRGFTFYGPGQKGGQLIPSVIESIREARPIILNDPSPQRDYLYIDDFLDFLLLVLRADFSGYRIYNIGGGRPIQNEAVVRLISDAAGNPVPIKIAGRPRKNDVSVCFADITKAKKDFRWEPQTDLETGIRQSLGALCAE